ncbi:MAG: hypothetical protein ACYC5H_08040 [Methylovirgula sp.]
MQELFRKLFGRIKPWLEAIEHFDFLFGAGFSGLLLKGVPIVLVLLTGGLGLIDKMPKTLVLLAMLGTTVLVMAVIYLGKQIFSIDVPSRSKALPKNTRLSGSKSKLNSNTKPIGLSGILLVAAVTGTLILIVQNYVNMHNAIDITELSIHPSGVLLPDATSKRPFGINLAWTNRGPLTIQNIRFHVIIEPVEKILSAVEEDQYIERLTNFSPLELASNELHPGDVNWKTFPKNRITMSDWQNVVNGSEVLYLFGYFDYFVNGQNKATELCFFLNKEFASAHNCIGHNRVISK